MTLWPHQQRTFEAAIAADLLYDTSDPGTGKTRAHLAAFDHHRSNNGGKALVVCPKSLMQSAWGHDIRKFFPHLTYSCAYAENREDAFKINADVYIINTDGVKALQDKKPRWFADTFGANATLIIDEATAFKHRTSQRSKALVKVSKHFHYRRGLTGTPYSNSVTEMWNQIRILDGGQHLGSSFAAFQQQVCRPEQVGPSVQHIKWVDIPGINDVVAYMIRDISIRHDFQDVMEIPENYARHIGFTLSRRCQKAYDEMANFMILELDNEEVTAVHAASLRTKLLQIASGAVYDGTGGYKIIDDQRYELVLDLVEERKHSVVFFNWSHQKELLSQHAKSRGIEHEMVDGTVPVKRRTEIVESYQRGDLQTLLLHPQTGAHGLTLTRGTATIWASPIYQPDFLKQGLHRVYRGSQTQKTENITVEAYNTVERLVYERLGDKQERMTDMLDLLKETHVD